MRKQQLFLWSLLIIVTVGAITINNYQVNNKVLVIGEVEGFMNHIIKTNLINNRLSYGAGCFMVNINESRKIEKFRVLTVDKYKLEMITFKTGDGYGISGNGYVSERGYIEYKDITLTEIESFIAIMIDKLSLYEMIPQNGQLQIGLNKRFSAGTQIEDDGENQYLEYYYNDIRKTFDVIESPYVFNKDTYRFNVYTDIKGDDERSKLIMAIYRSF